MNPQVTTLNTQNRRQKLSIGVFTYVQGLGILKMINPTDLQCLQFNFGGIGTLLGEDKPTKSPMATGLSIPPLWPGSYRG